MDIISVRDCLESGYQKLLHLPLDQSAPLLISISPWILVRLVKLKYLYEIL